MKLWSIASLGALLTVLLALLMPSVAGAQAGFLYQLDNGNVGSQLNASETSEARDNWFGNLFTADARGPIITAVDFQAGSSSYPATLGIYLDNGDANPPQAATLLYSQNFTPVANQLDRIALTTPVTLQPGDQFLVGVLMDGVSGSDYPFANDNSSGGVYSYWDRNFSTALGDPVDHPMAIGDLSMAVDMNHALIPGGWVPASSGCNVVMIRAEGVTATPEPATLSLLAAGAIGAAVAVFLRRKPAAA